jgi:hypothetical protein
LAPPVRRKIFSGCADFNRFQCGEVYDCSPDFLETLDLDVSTICRLERVKTLLIVVVLNLETGRFYVGYSPLLGCFEVRADCRRCGESFGCG